MNILKTDSFTKQQAEETAALVAACKEKWNMTLSFPFEDGNSFYLLYDTSLVSVLALIIPQEKENFTAEAIAFTLPERQGEGCFTMLLHAAGEEISDLNLLFPTDGSNEGAKKTLEALDACLDSEEYKMELTLDNQSGDNIKNTTGQTDAALPCLLSPHWQNDGDTAQLHLIFKQLTKNTILSEKEAGRAFAAFFKDTACLYGFEIKEAYRRRGLGAEGLMHFIDYVKSRDCRLIFLHVSSHNKEAVALYKKTGFRITETLSYWLY